MAHTCGEGYAEWERKKDFHDWRELVYLAIEKNDYEYLIELITDGLNEGYPIPDVSDPVAASIICILANKY